MAALDEKTLTALLLARSRKDWNFARAALRQACPRVDVAAIATVLKRWVVGS